MSHLLNEKNKNLEIKIWDKDSSMKEEEPFLNILLLNQVPYKKWYYRIDLVIHNEFAIENTIALIDNGAEMNCIQEMLVPT